MKNVRWLYVALSWFLLETIMLGSAFLLVAIYAYGIEPGHPEAFYEAYAQRASPWVSVVVGIPAFWLAGSIVAKRTSGPATVYATVATYAIIDLVIVIAMSDDLGRLLLFSTLSLVTKAVAAHYGARRA